MEEPKKSSYYSQGSSVKILIFQFFNCSILIHDDALEGDNRCVAVE